MRKKKSIILLSVSVFLILSIAIVILVFNSDTYNIKQIRDRLGTEYNASFEYIEKTVNEKGQPFYYFKWTMDESVVIKVRTGWIRDTVFPFLPFDFGWYEYDDFTEVMKEYILNKKYGGLINITDMSIEEASDIISRIMEDLIAELKPYHKRAIFDTRFILTVINGKRKKEIEFWSANESSIRRDLEEVYGIGYYGY